MPGVVEPPTDALAIVGLAGSAAELYDQLRDTEAVRIELQALVFLDQLSMTDKALVGGDPTEDCVEIAIKYVAAWWSEIENAADLLCRFPEKSRPEYLD